MDIHIEADDFIKRMLQNRIKELELEIAQLKEEKEKPSMKEQISTHLSPVMAKHLPKLRGYRQRFRVKPDGACLDHCLAVHVYEDANEGKNVKKRVNKHVADNWDNYYQNKIPLPYEETVGVGEKAKAIKKETRKEMLEFLYSDESLMVYSNSQQIHAMANLFNINITIFTYGAGGERWSEVGPDPEMVQTSEIKYGKWVPDMALYHSEETHFDLLVKDDSRLALLGLLAGNAHESSVGDKVPDAAYSKPCDGWNIVTKKSKRKGSMNNKDEVLLEENETQSADHMNIEEEMILFNAKQSGHRRSGPQELPECLPKTLSIFKCENCDCELESQGLLNAHMEGHVITSQMYTCEQCEDVFLLKPDLDSHVIRKHTKKHHTQEWNCNDCSFQGNEAEELLNHLRNTAHQPSKTLEKKKLFKDYRKCYTCQMEFDGFYKLMDHRKLVHPSNKKCRNFPGNCTFDKECWYVHEEPMDIDEVSNTNESIFKCDLCDEEITERKHFMLHRKSKHGDTVLNCEKFQRGECQRSNDLCWFKHVQSQAKPDFKKQVFQKAPENTIPPDQISTVLQMMSNLCQKVENIEKQFQELKR